jgi:hypothetical protein
MLTDSSYLTAIYIYLGSASLFIVCAGWWLSRLWRPAWVLLVMLLLAALLLTPAYPKLGVETMAPALVVAAFQLITGGTASADHALRPVIFMIGVAFVIALISGMTVFRGRRARGASRRAQKASASTAQES